MLRTHACLLAALVLLAGSGAAQAGPAPRPLEPPREIPAGPAAVALLRGWLADGTDREAAWGAWVAGERHLIELGPAVASRLGVEVRRTDTLRLWALRDVLMDAALRLDADVPAATLAGRGWTRADVATYLCVRPVGRVQVTAFEALDRDWRVGSRAWFAVGGRLFEARVPAFVRRLLAEWRIERLLRVWDRNGPYPPWRPATDGVPGDAIGEIPPGYPPIPQRRIALGRSEGWTRLVGGPFPVYGRRVVHRGRDAGWGDSGGRPDPDVARHAWLAAYVSERGVPPLPPWALVDVKWTGGRQPWTRRTTLAILDLHERWRTWRDALLRLGLITPPQCEGLAPRITWEIRDERRYRKHPIPPLPTVEFDTRVPDPVRTRREQRGI